MTQAERDDCTDETEKSDCRMRDVRGAGHREIKHVQKNSAQNNCPYIIDMTYGKLQALMSLMGVLSNHFTAWPPLPSAPELSWGHHTSACLLTPCGHLLVSNQNDP